MDISTWLKYMETARAMMRRPEEALPQALPLTTGRSGLTPGRGLDGLIPGNPGSGAPGFNVPQDVVGQVGEDKMYDFVNSVRNNKQGLGTLI